MRLHEENNVEYVESAEEIPRYNVIRVYAITPMGTCKPIVQTITVQNPCLCMMFVAIVHLLGLLN